MIIHLFDFVYVVVFLYEFFFVGYVVLPFAHLCTKRMHKFKKHVRIIN